MDPLSITASVITVLQAADALISICCNYRSAARGSSWEVPRVLEEVRALRTVLRALEELADEAETTSSNGQSRLPALNSLCDPDTGILNQCRTELENLTTKLTPPEWSGPAGSKRRVLVQALTWPLKKGDTEKVLAGIERFKSTINLAVTTDQTALILATKDNTQDIQTHLSSMSLENHQQQVRKWLRATDPSSKFNDVLEDRQPGTGSWFTNSRTYTKWMRDPNSLLWLHGIPGCGKTVLCSTAIEEVLQSCNSMTQKAIGVAYFYFDFKHQDQQLCDAMLRSLIAQLSLQSLEGSKRVDALYSACGSGTLQPSLKMTLEAFKDITETFTDVFILVDALDECKVLGELLTNVEDLVGSKIASLHLLVTSRREKEIEDSMSKLLDDAHKVSIQSTLVEEDIRAYVEDRIWKDRKLNKWQRPDIQAEIEEFLVGKAGGMFQWVKCQLDALEQCLSVSDLRKALRSLPKDLDETYARILQSIDKKGYGDQVAKIMQWLACSTQPMPLTGLAEVLTLDVEGDAGVDLDRRLQDPRDLLAICSSLVSTAERWNGEVLQFAHFSVREYLGSPGVRDGPFSKFAIDEIRANTVIAECCFAYLIHLNSFYGSLDGKSREETYESYPLFQYAATNIGRYAARARENGNNISLCRKLFLSESAVLSFWAFEDGWNPDFLVDDPSGKSGLLHFASIHNLPKIMRAMISEGLSVNLRDRSTGATPLMILLWGTCGRFEDIHFLLSHGAKVNARDNKGWIALMFASTKGCVQTVQLLLDNGADPLVQSVAGETILTVAPGSRKTEAVHLLLDRGASISSPIVEQALGYVSYHGYSEIVQILLDRGVDVDARCELIKGLEYPRTDNGTPLFRSLLKGHYGIADLLLKNGADVNARCSVEDRDAVILERVFVDKEEWERSVCKDADSVARQDEMKQRLFESFKFLIKHGADPKRVRVEEFDPEARERYTAMLSELNTEPALE